MTRRQFVVALVVVAVGSVVGGSLTDILRGPPAHAQANAHDVIYARDFRLVDENGETRGMMAVVPDAGPSIMLFDGEGRATISIATFDDGKPHIALYGEPKDPRIALQVDGEDTAALTMTDEQGIPRLTMSASLDETAVSLHDQEAAPVTEWVVGDRDAYLTMSDAEGRIRMMLSKSQDGDASMGLMDEELNALWSAP